MYIVFLVVFFIVVIFYAPLVAEQIKAAIASVGTQEAGTTSPLWLIYNNLTVDLHLSLQVLQGWFCLNSFGTL